MKSRKSPKCNVELPMELLTEILARLPVKSLLRFMCVCKSWHSLISSPDFVSFHFVRFHKDDDDADLNTQFYLCRKTMGGSMLRSVHTFKKINSRNYKHLQGNDCNWSYNCYSTGSSLNGLILFGKLSHFSFSDSKPTTNLILWNPVIGKTHKLPPLLIGNLSLGLGFSLSNNDYKVVALEKNSLSSLHVYSLSTHTWRNIACHPNIIAKCHGRNAASHLNIVSYHGLMIEGSIYWATQQKLKDVCSQMISFDVNNEVLDCFPLPMPSDGIQGLIRRQPVAYREWLGLLDVCDSNTCLWVMEKGQVAGTWYKLYTVDFQMFNMSISRILCFRENGEVVFETREGNIQLFNFETQHNKYVMKSKSFKCHSVTLYKESLVLI